MIAARKQRIKFTSQWGLFAHSGEWMPVQIPRIRNAQDLRKSRREVDRFRTRIIPASRNPGAHENHRDMTIEEIRSSMTAAARAVENPGDQPHLDALPAEAS